MPSKRIRISGRVQGVSFRAWTEEQASRLAVDGWVRNRRDGSVEALLTGDAEAVERMIEACRSGPPAARVDAVELLAEGEQAEPGFRVLPTA